MQYRYVNERADKIYYTGKEWAYIIHITGNEWLECADWYKAKGQGQTLVIAPQVDTAITEVLRYMACTKQRHALYLPSRSWYSFTDTERMEGW